MSKEVRNIVYSFMPGALMVLVLWLIKIYEWKSGISFADFGVYPRTWPGARGILLSPFIHGDFKHLISNSIPLLILSAGIFYFYKGLAVRVFLWVYFLGGFWLWLGGRDSFHIGASGLIYGLTTFLFLSGVLRRDTRLMALSLLVVFLYGGMVWGVFPLFRHISWEAHLFGALAGMLVAVVYRKEGPQRKLYEWEKTSFDEEEDENDEDDENAYWNIPLEENPELPQQPMKIHYIYRARKSPDSEQKNKTDDEKD